MGTELQSCDIFSINLTVKAKVYHFYYCYYNKPIKCNSCGNIKLENCMHEHGDLTISFQFTPFFTGKQRTSAPLAE